MSVNEISFVAAIAILLGIVLAGILVFALIKTQPPAYVVFGIFATMGIIAITGYILLHGFLNSDTLPGTSQDTLSTLPASEQISKLLSDEVDFYNFAYAHDFKIDSSKSKVYEGFLYGRVDSGKFTDLDSLTQFLQSHYNEPSLIQTNIKYPNNKIAQFVEINGELYINLEYAFPKFQPVDKSYILTTPVNYTGSGEATATFKVGDKECILNFKSQDGIWLLTNSIEAEISKM